MVSLCMSSPRLLTFVFPIIAPFSWQFKPELSNFFAIEQQQGDAIRSFPRGPASLPLRLSSVRSRGPPRLKFWPTHRSFEWPQRLCSSTANAMEEGQDPESDKAISIVSEVMGERGSSAFEERRRVATAQQESLIQQGIEKRQLVYGELQLDRFIMLMEAAGVRDMTKDQPLHFLDIGSGDGQLVFVAALVFPELFKVCRGVELVDGLVSRSRDFERGIRDLARKEGVNMAPCELLKCDIFERSEGVRDLVASTDIAVCFATTWDHDGERKGYVPGLSRSLAESMRVDSKVLMVDKRLCEEDGWYWEGSLDFANADVAPYSTAHLYRRQ